MIYGGQWYYDNRIELVSKRIKLESLLLLIDMLCVFNFNRMKKRISIGSTHLKVKRPTNYNTFAISPKKIVSENYMNFAAYRVLLDGNWSKTNNSTIKHFNHKLFNIIQNTQKPHTLLKLYTLNSTSGSIFSSCFTQIQITLY